jgi:hypothetical protein
MLAVEASRESQGEMARIARVGAPGIPHPIPHRGHRPSEPVCGTEDSQASRARMAQGSRSHEGAIGADCLRPNDNCAALMGPAGPWGASGLSRQWREGSSARSGEGIQGPSRAGI